MRGKSRKLLATLLTIFMLITNSSEVLAATNISGNIDKAASQMSSLASLIDSKLSKIESPQQKKARELDDAINKKKQELSKVSQIIAAPQINTFKTVTKSMVQIGWNSVGQDAEYELDLNGTDIKVGKSTSYLDAKAKENKKYDYKVRSIVNGKISDWSEIKEYNKEIPKEDSKNNTSVNDSSKVSSIAPRVLYATSAMTAVATDTPVTLNMLTHGSTTGSRWLEGCTDGMYGPLEGKMDAIKLSLDNAPADMKIKYQVYIKENKAWQDWKYNGDQAGEIGKTITAVRIKIDGSTYGYSIKYFGLIAGNNSVVYPDTYNGNTSGSEAVDAGGLSAIYMELYKSTVVIDKDTTWSPSDGVRTIDGFVEINENATLNIAPGTDIRFSNKPNLQSGFIVRGKINAAGSDTNRIKISAIDDNTDLTIKLTSKAVFQGSNLDIAARVTGYYGLFDSTGTISISSSKLSNRISAATGIVQLINSGNLTVDKCDISGFAEGVTYNGIGACKITNNNINGNGIGVRATTSTSISSTNLSDISNNTFNGNDSGIYITSGNDLISRKVLVYNNIIKASKAAGILIQPGGLSNIDVQRNQISATNTSKTAGMFRGPIVLSGAVGESKEDILATINYSDPAKANILSGNNYDGIVFSGAVIDADCTIQKGKYNIVINDELIINNNKTLKLKQGVVINAVGTKQSSDSGLTQWVVINGYYPTILVNGQLFCSGTSTEPVVITSVNDKGYGLTYIDNGDIKDTSTSAIYVADQGSFTSDNSIYKNSVIDGLYNSGQAVLNNSTFNNSKYTGIVSYGKLNLNKSTISNVTNPSSTDSFAGIGVLDFGEANLVNCNISNITHGSKTAVGALVGSNVGNLYINGGKISNCDNSVYVQNGSATLTNTQISGGKTGLTVSGGKANIVKNLFENCSLNAIDYINGTDYTIRYNSFTNSATTANALSNRASKTLNAQYNYWGSPYGPNQDTKYSSQKGLYVDGSVDYSNYLSQPIPLDTVPGGDYNNQIVNFITQLDYATQRHFGEEGVNLAAGNYSKTAKDMLISTPGMDIDVYRTYNSKAKDKPSIIGNGWRFSYESSIKDIDASAKITGKTITLPNGSVQSFELKSDGTYSALDSRNKLVFTNNQYILTSRTNDKYVFTNNLLTEMRDKNDNKISISYDASNNINTISDESRRSYVLSYTNGKLNTITENIEGVVKRSITYNYSNNLLQSVTDMNGHITESYVYDTQNRLKQVVKDSQVVEEVIYFDDGDNKDKIKTYKNSDGNLDTYEYNNTNRSVKTTDSNGAIREQYYDSSMFNILNVNPDGTIETTKYKLDDNNTNKYGDIVENKDSLGNTRYFELDSLGNITKQTNPDAGYKVSTYDANNNITKQVDESDKATYYVYDANGNMTKKVMPLNGTDVYSGTDGTNFAIEKYDYYTKQEMQAIGCNIGGLLKTKTDANGGITKYTYDKPGNPSTITDEEGNVTQFTYNEFGFKTVELSPNQFKTSYTYTNTGDILTTTYHDGSIRKTIYDALGRKFRDITPNLYSKSGDTTGSEITYYPNGRVKTTKDEMGNIKEYTYNLYGNVKTEKAPNGSIYIYDYDNMNRVIKKSFKDNASANAVVLEEYSYEINYSNSNNNNALRVNKKAYIDSTNFTTSSLIYNYNKQIVQTINEDQTTTKTEFMKNGMKAYETDENNVNHYYNYDGLNRLVSEYKPVDNSSGEVLYSYSKYDYDNNGNKIKESIGKDLVKNNAVTANLAIKESSYYKNGKLKAQWDNEGRKSEYEYDGNGNVTKQTVYTDKNGGKKIISYLNNYLNKPYKKSEQVVAGDIFGNAIDSTTILSLDTTYNYDLNGNLIKQTSPDGHEISYGYDNLDRQTSTTEKTLDETGTEVVSTTTKAYEWNGQTKETVDAKGNKTQYQYDAMGVQFAEINAKGDKTTYQHDLLGRITTKIAAKDVMIVPNITLDEISKYYGSKTGDSNWNAKYDLNKDGLVDIFDIVMVSKKTPIQAAYPTQTNLIYNSRGLVIAEQKVVYPNNDATADVTVTKAYKYDNKGNKIKELDALGYNAGTGTSIDEKISSGYGKEYQYNLSGKLVTETTATTKDKGLAFGHKYQYDGLLRMVKDTDANNNAITYDYNNAGKATSKKLVSATGTKELARYEYDLVDNVTLAVDGNGNKTTTTYNSLNKPKQTVLPGDSSILGDSIVYQYDKLGNQVFSQNSKGIISKNQRDPQGKILITTNTDAAGTDSINQEVKYDKNGNKRFVKDGNGNVTTYEYDELNRIKSTSIDVKNVNAVVVTHKTSYEYDANSNVVKETDYLGNVSVSGYDAFDRLIAKYDGSGKLVEKLDYNKNGTQSKSTDALGNVTSFEYDKDNRLISKTDAENNKSSQTYDKVGNVDTRTDAKGNKTVYSYDELSRLKSVLNAKSESTTYTYDNNGNMLEQIDAKGNKTIYEYNAGNKVSKIISPKGKTIDGTTITYDATKVQEFTYYENGNVKTHKDQNGVVTQYSYDIFGRETSEINPTATISFEYDKNGNQTKMTDSTGVTLREYDALNRVITKTVPSIGKSTYLYDVKDGVDLGFYAEVSNDPKANSVKKVYDKSDRLVKVIDGTSTTAYEYYDNGAKKSIVYPDGSREDYQYNKNNTLKTLVNKNSNATVIESFSYTYDAAGNISSKTDKKGQTTYDYDALNRVTSVKEPGGKNTSYTYDPSGNRQTETVVQNNVTNITTYSYDEQNRLTQTTKMQDTTVLGYKKYSYDNNGNVTKEVAGLANFVVPQAVSARMSDIYNSPEKTYDIVNSEIKDKVVANTVTTLISSSIASDNTQFNEKIVQYSYDNFNQLTEAKNDAGTILKNTYNGEGLRVSKEQGTQKTNLLYEGNQVVLEVDGATGTEKARNVYGNNLISRKSGTTTAYYMYNGHGDVTNLLDGKGGIIGSYYYDAFGNVQENTSNFSNPYRYAGYQYDEEIGKYYLLNRMYDPESARFMQEDTYRGNANDPLSLNLYTYVNNNPMIYDDQNGHWPSFIDNFFSSAKSVLSSAVSYVKNIYNDVINLPSTISSGFNYVKDTVYSWGQTINSTYKTIKTVYNKVVKPIVTNYAKQKVEEVKTGISVKAGEVANYVKNIDVPKLLFGGMSVVAGAGAIATGIGIGLVPGLQLVGIGLIGAGAASIVYGGAEVAESTMHVNPIKDFAEQSLGMSETAYDTAGMVVSTVSSAGTEAFAGIAKLGWSALRSKFSEGKIAQAIRTGVMFKIAKGGFAGDNKEIMPKAENKPVLGMCFTKDTIVKVKDGDKQIKDIKIGDMVYSENIETGEKGYKAVKQVFVNDASTLLHIKVKDTVINTTSPHPFYVIGKGWVAAKDLVVGDILKLANGNTTEIIEINVEKLENPVKVYNFEVEDWHTYYVSEYGVLVHNTGANPCSQEASQAEVSQMSRREAFRQAKQDAGIPKSSQYKTHKYVYDGTSENRTVYEFTVDGNKKYIVEHAEDKMGRGPHFHGADDAKGNPFEKGRYNQYDGHYPEDFNGYKK